jgi:muramoyltetrapeptide carboxypeptidase
MLAAAAAWLSQIGYLVRFSENCNRGHGYSAGTPAQRAHDLEEAFADPDVDAIICLGGGHATAQVLRLLDYELIAAYPKPFVGFSDITVLHSAFARCTGLVTFWGPMFAQLSTASAFTRNALIAALSGDVHGPITALGEKWTIAPGVTEGELVGGTLSLLCSLLGTPWEVETDGRVLLLEDVGEEPCRLDRYLTHLLNAGKLDRCVGVCVGELVGCDARGPGSYWDGPSPTALEVIERVLRPLDVPVLYGLPLGHGADLATVPLGVRVRLDGDAGRLEILEAAGGT